MRFAKISAVLGIVFLLVAVISVSAYAHKHGRPHGITCRHHKCHMSPKHKHHCRRNETHKNHQCRHRKGKYAPKLPGVKIEEGAFVKTAPPPTPTPEKLEINNLQIIWPGPEISTDIKACADIYGAASDAISVWFEAKESVFEKSYYAGKPQENWPERYCADYVQPPMCTEDPDPWCETSVNEEVWAVVSDESTGVIAESEHVAFEIEELEGVE